MTMSCLIFFFFHDSAAKLDPRLVPFGPGGGITTKRPSARRTATAELVVPTSKPTDGETSTLPCGKFHPFQVPQKPMLKNEKNL